MSINLQSYDGHKQPMLITKCLICTDYHVSIDIDCNEDFVDRGLSNVLNILSDCLKNKCKSRLKIRIKIRKQINLLQDHIVLVSMLMSCLTTTVDNFMLIFIVPGIFAKVEDEYKDNDDFMINTDKKGYCYISNRGCTLCGYNENWLMKCHICD